MKARRKPRLRSLVSVVLPSIICLLASSAAVVGATGPGWQMVSGEPVSPSQARAYYQRRAASMQATESTSLAVPLGGGMAMGEGGGGQVDAEIAELARGLRYDPDLMYQFVHDHIEYTPGWGDTKGAYMTLMDRSGNCFDQASLLIALLRQAESHNGESGVPYTIQDVQYVYGEIALMINPQYASWLGVPEDPAVMAWIIANSGIPVGVDGIGHVWVKVSIDGTAYVFDPSFKTHTLKSGINLASAMDYEQEEFRESVLFGADVQADYVKNLNTSNLAAGLSQYSANLISYIKTAYPDGDVALDDIIGGTSIDPAPREPLRLPDWVGLDYQVSVYETWDTIPSAFRTALEIEHCGIDTPPLYSSDIYGRRLILTYNTSNQPELWLDEEKLATGTGVTPGQEYGLTITIDHAYAGNGGTYCDQTETMQIKAGGFYSIVNGWGKVGTQIIEKHSSLLEQYRHDGFADGSKEVLGESFAVIAYTWLAEDSQNTLITDRIANTTQILHHNVGICGQYSAPYIDLPICMVSAVDHDNDESKKMASWIASGGLGSALEWGTIEQLQPDNSAVSTVKLLDIANNQQDKKIFNITNDNYDTVIDDLANYTEAFKVSLTQQFGNLSPGDELTVILPESSNLGAGSWSGYGYISYLEAQNGSASLGHIISGGYNGGYSTVNTFVAPKDIPESLLIHPTIGAGSNPTTRDPIDLVTGHCKHESMDLSIGSGDYPLGLEFRSLYNSAFGLKEGPLGLGWTHNFDITAKLGSDGFQAMGADSAIDAAASIVQTYTSVDLLCSEKSIVNIMIATLSQKWRMDRMIDNVVTIKQGHESKHFMKVPAGPGYIYNPPPGVAAKLDVDIDVSFLLKDKNGNVLDFDTQGRAERWSDPHDNKVELLYDIVSGQLSEVRSFFAGSPAIRKLTFSYTDNHVSSVTDSATRSVSYDYDGVGNLTKFTDSENKDTIFEYSPSNDAQLTHVYYPTDPEHPFVTNVYDGLGRVKQQTNANGQVYDYHYSYYRTEELQPEETPQGGDPHRYSKVYYFDDYAKTIAEIDQLGRPTTYEYDGQQRLKKVTYPHESSTEYSYDYNHNIETITRKDSLGGSGITESSDYEEYEVGDRWFNKIKSHTDAAGNVITYEYDLDPGYATDAGNLMKITYPAVELPDGGTSTPGNTYTSFTYNDYGQVLSEKRYITNSQHTTTRYEYYAPGHNPGRGGLKKTIVDDDGLKITTQMTYDSVGNVTTITDPRGNVTTNEYYNSRKLKKVTDALGHETHYEYYPEGELKSAKRETDIPDEWQITRYTYTPTRKVEMVHGPTDDAGAIAYDVVGGQDGTIHEAVLTDGMARDARTFDGSNDYVEADVSWQPIGFTDFCIAAWIKPVALNGDYRMILMDQSMANFQFNLDNGGTSAARMEVYLDGTKRVSNSLSWTLGKWYHVAVTRYEGVVKFYRDGICVSPGVQDQSMVYLSTSVNIGFRHFTVQHPFNGSIDEVLVFHHGLSEAAIQLLHYNGLNGDSALKGFASQGYPVAYWSFDEMPVNLIQYKYDALDRVSEVIDGESNVTKKLYHPDGQLHQVVNIMGEEDDSEPGSSETDDIVSVTNTYDAEDGLLSSVKDAKGYETTYTYDAHGRLEKTTYQNGSYERLEYDTYGRPWRKTTRAHDVLLNTYDTWNRLSTRETPDTHFAYEYDLLSRQINVKDPTPQTVMHNSYDNAGRLTSVTYNYPVLGDRIVGYDYDPAGNRTRLTYPDGKAVVYRYDTVNRLTGIRRDDSLVGYWKMNESIAGATTVEDSSGHNNHGTAQRNTKDLHTTGKINDALIFNGDSDYITTNSDELKTLNNFAIVLWFKTNTTYDTQHLVWQGQTGGNGWGGSQQEMHISLRHSGGNRVKLCFFLGKSEYDSGALNIEQGDNFCDTQSWHYVAVVVSNLGSSSPSPAAQMFLDDAYIGTDTGTTQYTQRNLWGVNFRIGRPSANSLYFDGAIDNVMIFNVALMQDAITALYNGGSGTEVPPSGYASNLVAHWKMNENESTTAPDAERVIDYSGSDDHGIAQRPTRELYTEGAQQYLNGAFAFDGGVDYKDYITTTSTRLKTLNNFTIALWFKADLTDGQRHLLWQGKQGGNGWGGQQEMHISFDNGKLVFLLGKGTSGGDLYITYSSLSNPTSWHYVAVVVSNLGSSSPAAQMFLDGNLTPVGSDTGTLANTARSDWDCCLVIGKASTDENYFKGTIDNVMIFDTALSPEKIVSLYNETKEFDPPIVQYDYDALSARISAQYENGTSAAYTYDMANRLMQVNNDTLSWDHVYQYDEYDNVGNRLSMLVNGTELHSYTYDDAYRLTGVDYQQDYFVGDTVFDYDKAGNRFAVANGGETVYATNCLNQYTSTERTYGPIEETTTYFHNLNGNLTHIDGTPTYSYDGENRLTEALAAEAAYAYDPLGRRTSKTVDGKTTYYVYDGSQVICEYSQAGVLSREFVYGTGIDEVIRMAIPQQTADINGDESVGMGDLRAMAQAWLSKAGDMNFDLAADLNTDDKIDNCDTDILAANWLLSGGRTENHYYYHYDGLGSVIAISDESGNTIEKYEYSVYGEVNIVAKQNGETRPVSIIGNPYYFTGRRLDTETGLYYYRARMYSASLGRFMQTDPIGYADGINWYVYCSNNPLAWVDPFGLCEEAPTKLAWDDFYKAMEPVKTELVTKPVNESFPIWKEAMWDSVYFQESNKNRRYELGGTIYKGSELNYYGIGMLMRREGKSDFGTGLTVILWKEANIPWSRVFYFFGLIGKDDVYRLPTRNELHMLAKGYHQYDGPIYESPPSIGWDGLDGVFYEP